MANAELAINIKANNQSKAAFAAVKRDIGGIKSALGDVAKFAGGQMLASGLQAGVRAMTGAVKGMIGTFAAMSREAADFNAQISTIGAVIGATTGELADLKKLATDLGVDPNLKVSATEAAQAIEMLGRNGLKVPDIMNGAAKATVLLANATGAEFATAADIGTDAMALFGISAADMIKAVDGITSVTTNSKFSIDDYRLALAQGGGVAATVGVSFEDFNTTIAAISPLFASGSDAGTSYKTFLQRLVPSTKPAIEAMRELGLITANGSNQFFDAQGNMKDMAEITGILNKATQGLTEQQKIHYLSTIFGTDAMRAAAGVAGMTEQEYRNLQATMSKTDATKAAAMRMDNLAGDMEIFQGVVDSLRIQIGDEFDPALRQMFQAATSTLSALQPVIVGFARNIGQGMAGGIQSVRDYKAEFDQLFGFFGGDRMSGMLAAIGKLTGAQVNVPIGKTTVEVDWGGLKASFDRATKDLSLSIGNIITGTFNLKDYTTTLSIGDFFTGTLSLKDRIASVSIGDFFAGAQIGTGGKISLTFNDTQFDFDLGAIKDRMIAQFNLLKTGLLVGVSGMSFSSIAETITDSIKSLPDTVRGAIGLTDFNFSEIATLIGNRIKNLPTLISGLLGVDVAGMDFTQIATDLGTKMQTGLDLIFGETGIMTQMSGFITDTLNTVSTALSSVDAAALGRDLSSAVGYILGIITGIGSMSIEGYGERITAVSGVATSVLDFLSNFASGFDTTAITDGLGTLATTLGGDIKDALTNPEFIDLGESAGSFVKNIITKIGETFATPGFGEDLGQGVGDAAAGFAAAAMNIAKGIFTELEKVDWAQFASNMSNFTQEFVSAFASSLANADLLPLAGALVDAIAVNLANLAQLPGQVVFDQANQENPLNDTTWSDLTPTWVSDLMGWSPAAPAWTNDPIPVAQPQPPDPSWWPTVPPPPAGFFPQIEKPTWKIDPPPKPTWVDVMAGIVSAFGGTVNAARSVVGGGGGGGGKGGFGGVSENANGTNFFEGGWTWVGEKGPELLNLPRGSKIMSNPESKKMIGQMADGNTTAPTGAFGGLAKILGFAASVLDQSISGLTAESEKGNAATAENTQSLDANNAALAESSASTRSVSLETAKTLGTVGELIRVSAEEYAKAAGGGNYIIDGVAHFSDEMKKLMESFGDDLQSALQNVPGLFGTSQVTDEQMQMAELGIPQNFADDWIRRLSDEVLNGVDWEGVDIQDAARRAGIDPSLPAEAILGMVKEKWNDKSFFADPANLDLINLDAVQAELQRQAAMKAGAQNLLSMFGITPETAEADGQATGQKVGSGVLTGMKTALTGGEAGEGMASALSSGVTEESMAEVSSSVVGALTTEMGKAEYGEQMAGAIGSMFSSFLENTEALAGIAQGIMEAVAKAFATVTNVDMVSNFASSFSTQLNSKEAGDSLSKVGEKILELVYKGYLGAAEEKNWAEGVNAKAKEPPTTTTAPGNAVGTRNWRGGLTWVGETGAELVNLPGGSRIFSNSDSMTLAGAGTVNVTINATVSDNLDIERLAYRVADVIRGRRH